MNGVRRSVYFEKEIRGESEETLAAGSGWLYRSAHTQADGLGAMVIGLRELGEG